MEGFGEGGTSMCRCVLGGRFWCGRGGGLPCVGVEGFGEGGGGLSCVGVLGGRIR